MGLFRKQLIGTLLWLLGMVPAAALAAPEQLCVGQFAYPTADGRILGHLPYAEALKTDLVSAPPGFALGQPCLIQRDAAIDLTRLLRAANAVPGVAKKLRSISCTRTIARQRQVFCSQIGPGKRFANAAGRARFVGPPGFSEHATGYALDFGIRPSPGCPDVDSCIGATLPGRWLLAHAPEFGFELSFPAGNAQGVTWEPWHWRWVGASLNTPGAIAARAIFARARTDFAASPAVIDVPDLWLRVVRDPPKPTPPAPVFVPPGRIEVPPDLFPGAPRKP